MNRRIPPLLRSLALLSVVAIGAAGCVAYPAGPYAYRPGWRGAPPAYAYTAPRPHWGGGWGHRH